VPPSPILVCLCWCFPPINRDVKALFSYLHFGRLNRCNNSLDIERKASLEGKLSLKIRQKIVLEGKWQATKFFVSMYSDSILHTSFSKAFTPDIQVPEFLI